MYAAPDATFRMNGGMVYGGSSLANMTPNAATNKAAYSAFSFGRVKNSVSLKTEPRATSPNAISINVFSSSSCFKKTYNANKNPAIPASSANIVKQPREKVSLRFVRL